MKKIMMLLAVLALCACSKLTNENYEQLKMGMSSKEIIAILGEADSCSEILGTKSCIWGDEKAAYIKVAFVGDNAATFTQHGLK